MRFGKIEVVRHEGELLFKTPDGILMDSLTACDFYEADIRITRGGIEFDTGWVREVGTFGSIPVFYGLNKIIYETSSGSPKKRFSDTCCHYILSEYFEEGDNIHFILSHPFDWEVDFRVTYAESKISEKLAEREDLLMDFVNDENLKKERDAHAELFAKELATFVFPETPILRRRKK